jgi:hypothetical protein
MNMLALVLRVYYQMQGCGKYEGKIDLFRFLRKVEKEIERAGGERAIDHSSFSIICRA